MSMDTKDNLSQILLDWPLVFGIKMSSLIFNRKGGFVLTAFLRDLYSEILPHHAHKRLTF